jgi:hypothetical protein
MHKDFIEAKYKNFLKENFYFSFDQEKVCEILSRTSNENLKLIIDKSPKILNQFSCSQDKIQVLKIFAHSEFDKIHALCACEKILDEFYWGSEKIDLLKKLDKIDAAHTYSVSLAENVIHNISWKSDKIKLLDKVINARNAEEAFDLLGYNDEGGNLPFHEIYYNYKKPYYNDEYYHIHRDQKYDSNYSNYSNKYHRDIDDHYHHPKNQPTVIHNHYHVNNESKDNLSSISSENENESAIGTAGWLGLAGVVAGAAYALNGLYGLFSSDDSDSNSDFTNYSNNKRNQNSNQASAPLSYETIYPNLSGFRDDNYKEDDLPHSYNSLYPNL